MQLRVVSFARLLLVPAAALVLLASVLSPSTARAGMLFSLGADLAAVVPTGTWADRSGVGIGGFLRGEFEAFPMVSITGRIGYLPSLAKEVNGSSMSTSSMPILIGGKYYLMGQFVGLYAAAELGVGTWASKAVVANQTYENSHKKMGFTAGVGFKQGPFDLRGQVWSPSISDTKDNLGLMVTLGYNFLSL